MKLKNCAFPIIVFALLFAACENKPADNVSVNLNKTPANQTPVKSVSDNKNSAANADTVGNTNVDTEPNTSDTADFEGTAGITDKKNNIKGVAVLREVRSAQHGNYDRVVFEFEGAEMPGYHIEYIDKPVRACGSGAVVPLKGDGWLQIRFEPAHAHTEAGEPTVKERERAPNHQIIKEMKSTCDFEAQVEWVLGVASPNKYRVLELKNPTRLAVDIKHQNK